MKVDFHRRVVAAGRGATVLFWALVCAPAAALQILEAVDHAELTAQVSSRAVSRIAFEGDRIQRVVQSSSAFTVEHDPVRGDLYLYPVRDSAKLATVPEPATAGAAEGTQDGEQRAGVQVAARAENVPVPVTLYVGTEQGFTYRLSLTPAARDSAQILIRNSALKSPPVERAGTGAQSREHELSALIRAVSRRQPLEGYAIIAKPNLTDEIPNVGETADNVALIEVWRGARFTARVLAVRGDAHPDASRLAAAHGRAVAAAWLSDSVSGPADSGSGDGEAADNESADAASAGNGRIQSPALGREAVAGREGPGDAPMTRLAVIVEDNGWPEAGR